jgi:hypothetical protein
MKKCWRERDLTVRAFRCNVLTVQVYLKFRLGGSRNRVPVHKHSRNREQLLDRNCSRPGILGADSIRDKREMSVLGQLAARESGKKLAIID